MHDLENPANTLDSRIATSPELLGKECVTCLRILAYNYFNRDSSYRDGHRDRCYECENAPKLPTAEHTAQLKEMNLYAAGKYRWKNQEDYENEEARKISWMHSSEFLHRLRQIIGCDKIWFTDGRFLNDIAIFRISGVSRPDFDGPRHDFKYMWYLPVGWMPEFSIYEFDERWIPVRESKRGWRTPLLRLIKSGILTEEQVEWEFGPALGEASTVYKRDLFNHRNRPNLTA
jgi:hypothetical protein